MEHDQASKFINDLLRLMVDAARGHEPRSLERVVFAVHGDEAERAFRDAVESSG